MHSSGYAVMISEKEVILDLNGRILSASAFATVYITATGSLTVKDSSTGNKIINTRSQDDWAYEVVGNYGDFNLISGELYAVNGVALYNYHFPGYGFGKATINGGTLYGGYNGIQNSGVLEISGGEFTGVQYYDINNSGEFIFAKNMIINKVLLKNDLHAYSVPDNGIMTIKSGVALTGFDVNSKIKILFDEEVGGDLERFATVNIEGINNFYDKTSNPYIFHFESAEEFEWDNSSNWLKKIVQP